MNTVCQIRRDTRQLLEQVERPSRFRCAVIWLTLLAYLGQPLIVIAQVIADQAAPASKRPLIDVTANGLPLVQIATPSAAGVSHNQYTQFNVDPAGIILNNSQSTVLTRQAGYVAANPNLVNGASRVILNEITSTARSQLNGYTEVAGQQAEVIIANPNGISCNGCGFINTSRGVLTTAAPVMGAGGSLDAFRVTGGDIQIGAAGLNGSNLNQLDLISRSLQVNGQVWANTLNVITGANQVDYNTLGVQVIPGIANKPAVGIDVALLGGMYANKIKMIGTEAGVGVNSLGTLAAQAGDFTLDSQGQITLAGGINASGNLSINSNTGIANSGTIYSQQSAQLSSAGSLSNSGTVAAQNNLTFNADTLNSNGILGAGMNTSGVLTAAGNLAINTVGQTLATGQNLSGGSIGVTASDISFSHSQTYAQGAINANARAGNINLSGAQMQSATAIALIAPGSLNNTSGQIGSNQDLLINVNTIIGNGLIIAGRDAGISLQGNYTNAAGNTLKANRNLTIDTTGDFTNQAILEAGGVLSLNAANIDNQGGARINANLNLLGASGTLNNAGRIEGNMIETHSNNFNNTATVIGNNINVYANSLNNLNAAALIGGTQNVNLTIVNALNNQQGAILYSLGDINIGANLAQTPGGYLTANTASVTNSSATIEALGNLRIAANAISNKRSVVGVEWGASWNGAPVTGVASYNGAGGSPSYVPSYANQQFTAATTPAAQMLAGANLWLSGGALSNDYSSIIAGGALNAQLTSLANNGAAFQQREIRTGQQPNFVWAQTGWHWSLCGGWPVIYPCAVNDYGWVNAPLPYAPAPIYTVLPNSVTVDYAQNTPATVATRVISLSSITPGTTSVATWAAPSSGLYTLHTQPGQKYLVVTDPRFANYQNFVSSDYMLSRVSFDPQRIQKRLGDGFYEQKLINDQIMEQTGRRYLGGYSDAQTQFLALLDSGVQAAQDFQLSVGIALTPTQIDALRQDIVWMVARDVTLPNGKTERVLAPQLYLSRSHQADLKSSGALLAANDIQLTSHEDLVNSGAIQGGANTVLNSSASLINHGGVIGSRGFTLLKADNDIRNLSGNINGQNVGLSAGRDIINQRASRDIMRTASMSDSGGLALGGLGTVAPTGTSYSTELGLDAGIQAGNLLSITAGRDLAILAAHLDSGGDAALSAGRNVEISALTTRSTSSSAQYAVSRNDVKQLGSTLQTGGNLQLQAGNDVTLTASKLTAGKEATLAAGGNLTFIAGKDSSRSGYDSGAFQQRKYDETVQRSSLDAGGNITLLAQQLGNASQKNQRVDGKGNIVLQSAAITSKSGNLSVIADGTVDIGITDEQHNLFNQSRIESSKLLSSTTTTTRNETNSTKAVGSSLDGNSVTIRTRQGINVLGSDVVATHDVALLAGNDININASQNTSNTSSYRDESTSGLFSNGGASITLGSKQQTDTQTTTSITHNASTVGSINGNVSMMAGKQYTQSGSDVIAPQGNIDIAAQTILINEVQNHGSSVTTSKSKQSGLTASLSSPVLNAAQTIKQMDKAASQTQSGRMKLLAVANAGMAANSAMNAISSGGIGSIDLNVSLGNSSSETTTTQTWSQAQGSTVRAGGNVNLSATGAGKQSDLTVQGSHINAGNDTTLQADNTINLLAAQSTSTQTSTNRSSSNSVGAGISTNGGFTINLAASRGRGNSDGNDLTWTNTQLDAGNTLVLKSGADTTLKGAVTNGKQVIADVGGNLNIQSLQDTSTYTSQQQSAGFSVAIPIAGTGGASIHYSKTNINSHYASVTEQSGIKAGDGGYQVNVKGDTTLTGSVIAASDQAIAANKTTFNTGGKLSQSDIQNQADYTANSVGVSAGVGSSLGASGGVGSDSGHANSVTHSGIGISTKTDTTGAIKPIFNAQKVTADVNAQVQITQTFSQQAPKAVGDYAQSKLNEAAALRQQANAESDPARRDALIQQADALQTNWSEGGAARVALHTTVGALGGGLAGAAGAGTSALTVPLIADQIKKLDIPVEVKQALILVAGTAVAGATGGTAGAAAGLGETANNYLLHESLVMPQKSEAQRYADATTGCANHDAGACKVKGDLETLSLNRDKKIAQDCNNGVSGACQVGMALAVNNGSHLSWTPDGKMVVTSPEYPVLTNQDRQQGFDQKLAPTMVDGIVLETTNTVVGAAVKAGAAAVEVFGRFARGVEVGASNTLITDVRAINADLANAPFIARGWNPPYDTGSQVRTFTTTSDLQFVRVSTTDNPQGAFLVRTDEIAGMTPQQIQQHLALPSIPTQIADVIVPSGTPMQMGRVAAQPEFGVADKGGMQYQLLDTIPSANFGIPRPLK